LGARRRFNVSKRASAGQGVVLPPEATWDIFISYAHEDADTAQRLGAALKGLGWSVWIDDRLRVGRPFSKEIKRALETSRSVIVLWSQDSAKSEWVLKEAGIAVRRGVLVPVMLQLAWISTGQG
jgi:hypothetical protein